MKINKILFLFLVIIANTLFASQKEYEEYLKFGKAVRWETVRSSLINNILGRDIANMVADYDLQTYSGFNKERFEASLKDRLYKKHTWSIYTIPVDIVNAVRNDNMAYLNKLLSDRFAALNIYLAAKVYNKDKIVDFVTFIIYPEYKNVFENYYTNYKMNPILNMFARLIR